MTDDNFCPACLERPPADESDLCNWCADLCLCCVERPIEAALTWGRRDGLALDVCVACRTDDERRDAAGVAS